MTRAIADKLKAMPEVRSVMVFGGQILGGASEPRKASFVINFVHKSKREASQKDLQTRISAFMADVPDVRFWFLKDNGQRDLQLIVAGHDIDQINDTANQIASEMRTLPSLENPISTAELDRPELQIAPRRQVAADLGVSTEALSTTIRVATLGDIDANLAKFKVDGRLIPIRVELDEAARERMGVLQNLRVPTGMGGETPLASVADFVVGHGPTAINRYDRSRRVTIEADLAGDAALGPGGRGHQGAADGEKPAAGRRDPRDRRRRDHERGVPVLRAGDGRGPDDGLRPAGAAVWQLPAADHHPDLAAAVDRRLDHGAA